jgi:hypothetical protein
MSISEKIGLYVALVIIIVDNTGKEICHHFNIRKFRMKGEMLTLISTARN